VTVVVLATELAQVSAVVPVVVSVRIPHYAALSVQLNPFSVFRSTVECRVAYK